MKERPKRMVRRLDLLGTRRLRDGSLSLDRARQFPSPQRAHRGYSNGRTARLPVVPVGGVALRGPQSLQLRSLVVQAGDAARLWIDREPDEFVL